MTTLREIIISVAIQACTFIFMVVVGLDLTREDFARVAKQPGLVFGSIAAQWLLLPAIAWVLVAALPLPPSVVAGVVLLAACPAGAISNYYSLIARADVALSMTLTAVSIVVAAVKMPLLTSIGFNVLLDESTPIEVPVVAMVSQLLVFLLLPTVLGMWIRSRYPAWARRHMTAARHVGDAAIVATALIVFVGLKRFVIADLGWTVATAVGFVVLAFTVGLVTSRVLRANGRQMQAIAIEFSCRNNGIMAIVGLVVLERPELAAFALIVFLVQVPLVFGGTLVTRSLTRFADGRKAID